MIGKIAWVALLFVVLAPGAADARRRAVEGGSAAGAQAASAQADADAVQDLVGRHLAWLDANPIFQAELSISDGTTVTSGVLYVDREAGRSILVTDSPRLPQGIYLKTTVTAEGDVTVAFSKGLERTDDLPLLQGSVPPGPFGSEGYGAFLGADGTVATVERLRAVSNDLQVRGATPGMGISGLSIGLNGSVMDRLFLDLESIFTNQRALPAAPDEVTLWFDEQGRLSAAETSASDQLPAQIVRLAYPDAAYSKLPPPAGPAAAPGDFSGLSAALVQVPSQLAPTNPEIASWIAAVLSLVLGAFSLLVLQRLRSTPVED